MSGHIAALSDSVTRKRVVYQNRYGLNIVGELYRAKELDLSRRHPALIVGAPYGGVKEQGPCVYGDHLAQRGFVVCIACPDFFQKSGRAHSAAAPFPTKAEGRFRGGPIWTGPWKNDFAALRQFGNFRFQPPPAALGLRLGPPAELARGAAGNVAVKTMLRTEEQNRLRAFFGGTRRHKRMPAKRRHS